MGFAIARILKICFANIREVTGRIEVNFDMCITNIYFWTKVVSLLLTFISVDV